jgi:putative selenium metabolism protein SsnA
MLITHATLITWDDRGILSDYALYIGDGAIRAIGTTRDLLERYPQAEQIDARGQLVMPGNICAHTHFYSAYARGMAIPGDPAPDFPAILRKLWWPLDLALDKDSVRASVLVSLVDAIKHGTTSLIDHHASPNFIEGSLDVIADAIDEAGLRAVLCYEVTDRNGREGAEAGIAENLRFLANNQRQRVRGTFGLHASMTLSDDTLRRCAEAHNGGFHVHVAEHEADEDDSLQRSGVRTVQRLNHYGILGEKTIAAHCIHVDESETDRLAESGTWITHQPRSNMNNGVGAMAFDTMMQRGLKVCLGNDGFSNNMWADWKAAYLLHKVVHRDLRLADGGAIAQMAVENNSRLMGNFFPDQNIGHLTVGARADLIFVDYHPFTPLTGANLPWHVLFGFEASMVTTTIVDGKILMRDRQLLTLDEKAVAEAALALAPGVWQRYTAQAKLRN